MTLRIRPYLELVRVFLTPTAAADSLTGHLVALSLYTEDVGQHGGSATLGTAFLATITASILLYWFGMAANDVFDAPVDRYKAPSRPIPSGRISRGHAAGLCSGLAIAALALGFFLGEPLAIIAVLVTILAYDFGGKRIPGLGNLLMGSCRGANFLFGAATALSLRGAIAHPELLVAAGLLTLYVAGVTAISELEDVPYSGRKLLCVASPCLLFPILAILVEPTSAWNWLNSALLALLLLRALGKAWQMAKTTDGASRAATQFVHKALAGLLLVNAGIALALAPQGAYTPLAVGLLYALYGALELAKRAWLRRANLG